LFLPVRSSLYACLPSVGPALVAAVGIHAIWTASSSAARRRLAVAATAVPICLLPVYWSRNERWVEIADLSAVTFAAVRDTVPTRGDTPHLIFHDDRATRRSLVAAFGTLLPEAVTLAAGRPLPVWLEPPPDDWKGSRLTPPASDATNAKILRYRVDGDTLQVRIDPPANGKGRL
jgi:hypothetical protein